jgi:hypothetical protein
VANLIVKVLDKATERDFLTLEEAKLLLGMGTGSSLLDEQLKLQISIASATIETLCQRVFARERVVETWRGLGRPQLFLTHFPVEEDDIEDIEVGGGAVSVLEPRDYELEEESGKLLGMGRFAEPVRITYTGGYRLPEEAPLPLKHATLLMVAQARTAATRESIEGVRMIAHKESRVMFYDPNQQQKSSATTGALGSGIKAVDDLLMKYVKLWM